MGLRDIRSTDKGERNLITKGIYAYRIATPQILSTWAEGKRVDQLILASLECKLRNSSSKAWIQTTDTVRLNSRGVAVDTWTGEIPLTWQHQGNLPGPRTIGNPANADIFAIAMSPAETGPVLVLQPQIPALSLPAKHDRACKLHLAIEIRSDEAVLDDLGIWVECDGEWHQEDEDMESHVRFELA